MSYGARAEFYHTKQWDRARLACLLRDHYICQVCGGPGEIVHHKVWLTEDNLGDPDVTLSLDNLVTVCRDCHARIHKAKAVRAGLAFDAEGNLIKL